MNGAAVSALWSWFAREAQRIAGSYRAGDHEWLDRCISPRVEALGRFVNWEIGPYMLPDDTFVLSPTVRDSLAITRAAVAVAPAIPGWCFLAAKPPKNLDSLVFSVRSSEFCADKWRYRLTCYNDGEFVDIELFVEKATAPPKSEIVTLSELVVEALVGEELRLERVGSVETRVVPNLKECMSIEIQNLRAHLDEVLAPIH